MSHIERRQKEKEEVKQKILDAAQNIAVREGWHAVTIRKIAEEIEYTPPIVYEHFENKEELIKEIVYSGFEILGKKFTQAREAETDSRKLIKALSMIHWDFAFENVELYQLMFSLERPAPTEEMAVNMGIIKNAFLELIGEKESLHETLFSWMCLMNGAISVMMKFPHVFEQKGIVPRELFSRVVNRFVDRL